MDVAPVSRYMHKRIVYTREVASSKRMTPGSEATEVRKGKSRAVIQWTGEGVNSLCTSSGIPWAVTSTNRSGFSGVSYSTPPTPGSPFSSPLLARAYTFLRSVASACSNGVAT